MFNDTSSTLALLRSRRSGKARDLVAPGPDDATLADILAIATRVPDHGKLAPWRIVVIPQEQRAAFATMMTDAYRAERPEAGRLELETIDSYARHAPVMLALLSTPVEGSKIPLWEQQASAGAVAMQLLNAAHAHGFAGNWLSGWPAESRVVTAALGGTNALDRVYGFFFIGTQSKPLEERPRPEQSQIISIWTAS
jgi:nitroreductase